MNKITVYHTRLLTTHNKNVRSVQNDIKFNIKLFYIYVIVSTGLQMKTAPLCSINTGKQTTSVSMLNYAKSVTVSTMEIKL